MSIQSYKDLVIWKKGIELSVKIYDTTRLFPKEEKFGLISQMNRAATSVPANIAEGWSRNSNGSFIQFLNIAKGSLAELDTFLFISQKLKLIDEEKNTQVLLLITELQKRIESLKKTIINKRLKGEG
ncbi:MAG TPA: four helix bundle protein [Bacteroidia bacterium]|nr:four helix bundle protein [Bacteroidia bacterium]